MGFMKDWLPLKSKFGQRRLRQILLTCTTGLTLALSGCAPTPPPAVSGEALAEAIRAVEAERLSKIGLAALDRFQQTWNTSALESFSQSLHYPHMRPSAGNFGLSPTPVDYIQASDGVFERVKAAGWHRSQWNNRRVLHVSRDKIHVSGQYSRYREGGERLATQQVTYIVTRQADSWAIQARFGTGFVQREQTAPDIRAEAEAAVMAYFDAFNSLDPERWADTLHFPQVRLSSSGYGFWETRAEFLAGPEPGRLRTWPETRVDSLEVSQNGPTGANLDIRYSVMNEDDEALSTYDAVFLATLRDGRWGVQAHSTYGP